MRASLATAALAIICASFSNADILGLRKKSQITLASTCPLAPSDLLNITIGPAHDWSRTAETLSALAECADQLHTTRELSIDISIPFDFKASASRIKARLLEALESGAQKGFITRKTIEFSIRPPQKTISQADFREHGHAEFQLRQEDFNVHGLSQKDFKSGDDNDWRRFDFMAPFEPETAQLALREYQASLQPNLPLIPPPNELLDTLVTVLKNMTRLRTLRLRIDPPEHEIVSHFNQTFHTAKLRLTSITSLHLSPGMDFLTAFTPNINFITSIGIFNTVQSLSLIRSSHQYLRHLTLRTRWDERKLQAIVDHCPYLVTLRMLAVSAGEQRLTYRRNHPDGDSSSSLEALVRKVSCTRKEPREPRNVTKLFEELPTLEALVVN